MLLKQMGFVLSSKIFIVAIFTVFYKRKVFNNVSKKERKK